MPGISRITSLIILKELVVLVVIALLISLIISRRDLSLYLL
jgi:hypothetical protein